MGTAQMKQAMNEHVVLERVSISAYGKIAEQEKAVLRMMGASLYDYSAGFVDIGSDNHNNPVPVIIISNANVPMTFRNTAKCSKAPRKKSMTMPRHTYLQRILKIHWQCRKS